MSEEDQKNAVVSKPKATPLIPGCSFYAFLVAVCSGCISGLTIGQAQYAFGTFVGPIAEEFPSWTRLEINTALSVGMTVSALMAPVAGCLLDRFGVRIVVPLSACLVIGGWVCISYTHSLWLLYLGFALVYFAFPSNTMMQCGKVVGAWFPQSRGKVMGLVAAGNNTGGVLMILLSSTVAWRVAAVIFAALQAVVAVLYFVFVRDSPEICCGTKKSANAPQDQETATEKSVAPSTAAATEEPTRSPLRNWRFPVVTLAQCCCFWTYSGCLTQLFPGLIADGVDEDTATGCLTLVGATGIASKILAGFLTDKIGAKRSMQIALSVQLTALLLLVLHGCLPVNARHGAIPWAASGIYGLGFGAVGALLPLMLLEEYGVKIFGKAAGIIGFFCLFPGVVGPGVAGWFFDNTAQYTGAFGVSAGVFFLGLVVIEFLCRTAPATLDTEASTGAGNESTVAQGENVSTDSSDTIREFDNMAVKV